MDRLSRLLDPVRRRLGPLAWGTAIVFAIQRGADVANLICKLFLGRALPPMDFGAVEPIFATLSILSLPAGIIFGSAVKSISRLHSQGREAQCRALIHDLEWVALIGSILSVALVFALRDYILTRLHLDSPVIIWTIAILFVLTWWGLFAGTIIRAEYRYRLLSLNRIAGPFAAVATTVLLVGGFGLGLEGAIAARALSGVLLLSVILFLLRDTSRGERIPCPTERAAMLGILLPMGVLLTHGALASEFDRLFVRNFLVEQSAGLSAIFTLGQIPRMLIMPLAFVLFPLAAAQHASGENVGRILIRASLTTAAVTALCCLGFALFATPLLRTWRPEFAPYGPYVWIYALMTGLHALGAVISQVEMARSRYRFLWLMTPPIPIACAAIYYRHTQMGMHVTLAILLWTLIGAHLLALAATTLFLILRDRKKS